MIEAGIEEGIGSRHHRAPWIGLRRARFRRTGGELFLFLVEHRHEEIFFVAEVMIERAPRDTSAANHLLGAGRGVAMLREKATRNPQERAAGRGGMLGLA